MEKDPSYNLSENSIDYHGRAMRSVRSPGLCGICICSLYRRSIGELDLFDL
jgi:hypothetical protein